MAVELIWAAFSLTLGVYLSEAFNALFLLLFFFAFLLIWLIRTLKKRVCGLTPLVCAAAFVFGAVACRMQTDTGLRECNRYVSRFVTVTGRVSEIPSASGDNTRYVIDAAKISHNGETLEISERILITSAMSFQYNDTVKFSGVLKTFPEKLNENGFDLLRYYKSKNIFFKMYSEDCSLSDEKITDYSIYALSVGVKNSISQFINKYNRGDRAAVLKAVLTGNKKELSDDLYKVLIRTGTYRCLYPAFLHVMLIMSLIGLLSGLVRKKYRDIALIILLILYAVINSHSPVFLRVIILSVVTLIWKRRYGYADFKEMLSLTVIIVGVSNPLMLLDGCFIISVCAVTLIRCFYGYVYNALRFIKSKYARGSIAIGLICAVGLIPLSALYFGGTSLYSIIASALFIPPVIGIIFSFPIVAVMTAVFGTAPLVGSFMSAMAYIIIYVPTLMDKLISTYIIMPQPSLTFILAYAAAVIAAGYCVHNNIRNAKWAALVGAALFFSVLTSQLSRLGTLEVTFVNVGQGDGAVVDAPYQGAVIIDGGGGASYSDYNVGERVFVPYLEAEGITRIEAAFVSHYHKDHAEGIVAAIENLRVKNVFMPDVMPDCEYRNAIEKAAEENNTKVHYISKNSRVVFDNGLTVTITVPAEKTKLISEDENDTSLLFNVEYGGFNCLFTGDMTSFAERNLIESGEAADCEVLKVAHHGSNTATCSEWIDAVSPEYAVISVGETNEYNLPDDEVIERLSGSEVLRTDRNGDIKIIGSKNGIKSVRSYRR